MLRTIDIDVLALLLFYGHKRMLVASVYMHAGKATKYTNRERYIPTKIRLQMIERLSEMTCYQRAHGMRCHE